MSDQSYAKSCEAIERQLEAFLDGDLEAHQEDRLHLHLEGCGHCREALELAAAIQSELRALPGLDAPPRVLQAVLARTDPWYRRVLDRLGASLPTPAWATLAAAAALIAFIMLLPMAPEVSGPDADVQIAQATEEARMALAFVGGLSRRTGRQLRDDILVGKVVAPTTRALVPTQHAPSPIPDLDSNNQPNGSPPGARS